MGFTQCNHPKHNNPWWVVYKPSPNGTFMALGLLHILLINIFSCHPFNWVNYNLVGGFNPSEKYENQLGWWHSQYMDVPNHQPEYFSKPETQGQRSSMLQPVMAGDDSPVHSPWFQGSVTTWGHSNSSTNSTLCFMKYEMEINYRIIHTSYIYTYIYHTYIVIDISYRYFSGTSHISMMMQPSLRPSAWVL